ncbi:MAG: ABC transporter permease [Firmicutes bacterium]|nr:ABC transporter permease [Bacillota bacterium]
MSGFIFFKKEVKAIFKTYRIWLIPLIFIFLGILSPVTAKFLPAILKAALQADSTSGISLQGIKIPEPTPVDAYLQWLKNLSQFGMLALILLAMGLVAEEKARGTLALVVTKPVSRTSIVFSKFLAQAGLFAIAAALGVGTTFLYTFLLFDKAPFLPLAQSSIAFGVYGLLILSATILFSVLMKNQLGAGGLGLLSYFTLSILANVGYGFDKYSPGALSAMATKVAAGTHAFSKAYPAIGVSIVLSILIVSTAAFVLERQEL